MEDCQQNFPQKTQVVLSTKCKKAIHCTKQMDGIERKIN